MSKELEVELTKDSVKLSVGKEPTQALTRGLGDIFGLVTESFGIFKDKIRESTEICQENTRGSKELKSNSGTIC